MARVAQYTKALPVYVSPELRTAIEGIADTDLVSMAEVIRDILEGRRPPIKPEEQR